MRSLKRRDFLKLGAAATGGALLLGRRAFGAPFGTFPGEQAHAALPEGQRATSVLEIFLYGGLSQWESLYMVDAYGRPDAGQHAGTQFHAFAGTGGDSIRAALASCNFPADEPLGMPFGMDALGAQVSLGPFLYDLRRRADIANRMRILVQQHDLEPHEAAIPYALTGKRVGIPNAAGLGAHIQRYLLERDGARRSPYSYVFSTGGLPGDNVLAATATGMHPGASRPLRIKVDNAERLAALLDRPGAGNAMERAQVDELLSAYTGQYQERLRYRGQGPALRSPRMKDLAQAADAVTNVDGVKGVLDPALFVSQSGMACGDDTDFDIPVMSMKLAAHLLTHPEEPARYVCLVDTGLIEASGGGGYDTHSENSHDTARNLGHMLRQLTAIINEPGENDPRKLDLDKTLIILNTEFGRTPARQDGGSGRNHHPWGYATAMFGGPIGPEQRGIVGAIGPEGDARTHVTPAENRIAALLAMGIFPFAPDAFGVSDVQDVGTELDACIDVTERVLGVVR